MFDLVRLTVKCWITVQNIIDHVRDWVYTDLEAFQPFFMSTLSVLILVKFKYVGVHNLKKMPDFAV